MLRLLGRKTSGNVQKVLWMLEELEVEYVREDYGRQFGNTADDAYLQMNPTGKVPTLVDGDHIIWESNTILRYLCLTQNSDLLPGDPASRAQCETWMDWLLASLNSHYVNVFKESKKAEEDRTEIEAMGGPLSDQLSVLEQHLGGNEWIGGDSFSVADIALGPICNRCLGFPIDLPALANTRRWHELISKRTAYQKVVAA